jgi:hypothetical protein
MAFSKSARSKISLLVQDAKKLLVREVEEQLQQFYGIRPDGTVLMIEQLNTSDSEVIYTARLLRQRLTYLYSNQADTKKREVAAVRQLVREQAFTILNRFASLRMAEERGIIKESIRKAYNSEGFQIFDSITGQGQTASQYTRYKWYIYAIFDELSLDLPSVFDRNSPYALIFPSEQAMTKLLNIIDRDEVTFHREDGFQALNLWKEDETIGWIYQYYNSRDEITDMREASGAPRNSQELAVRNQFFTPRYVVQFLTDNSLGRIWYEMTQGKTILKTICPYLIAGENEIFLKKGKIKSAHDDNTLYVPYRAIKDPREILMLDPACGSMHFGLYAFDLMEHIYLEAWDNYPELLTDLKNSITRRQFEHNIPEYIIRYNIHGVDIDPRALQIAGLSLWLRAQKSFDKQDLKADQRPQIKRSNLVLAEPLPGGNETLDQLIQPLDAPMRALILAIWRLMKLAGDTGLLLRIEDEIDKEINKIATGLSQEGLKSQLTLENPEKELIVAEQAAAYATKKYRDSFLGIAEEKVINTLKELSETATNGDAYQKLLFADDTARGFAFIELCRKKYDVILMNPPFGASSVNSEDYLDRNYPFWAKNILSAFFERTLELLNNEGLVAAIFDRTVAIKSSYEKFRVKCFCGHITAMADTGWNVLDANVETTTLILRKAEGKKKATFIRLNDIIEKEATLKQAVAFANYNTPNQNVFFKDSADFSLLPNSIIGYYLDDFFISLFKDNPNMLKSNLQARKGHSLASFKYFRLFWESKNPRVVSNLYNGGPYNLFYFPYREHVNINKYDLEVIKTESTTALRNQDYQKQPGICYGKRGDFIDAHVFRKDTIFTNEGQAISRISRTESVKVLSFLNSIVAQYLINLYTGQHKESGYVNLLPLPRIDQQEQMYIEDIVNQILVLKRKWFALDETCLEFRNLLSYFSTSGSLLARIQYLQQQLQTDKSNYLTLVKSNDDFWIKKAKIPLSVTASFDDYKLKRPHENLVSIDGVTDDALANNPLFAYELISNLIGVVFGRWDIRSIMSPELIPASADFFEPLPFSPVDCLSDLPAHYPIVIPNDGIMVGDINHPLSLMKSIKKAIFVIWGTDADNIMNELEQIGQFNSIESFINNPNSFFDLHFKRYTKSRREAPIYWQLSTSSGSYTLWLYYPKINDQTLYKVVNDFIKPKQSDIAEEMKKLEVNPNLDNQGKKELQALQDLVHELQEMEKELLRVAALPYQPNQDDGVLISAAPLHNLFRHSKWKRVTEACWKELENGEFDWSHLAFGCWPERVKSKSRRDLSIAVAHGLESLCEIKPKEKKATAVKPVKTSAASKLFE